MPNRHPSGKRAHAALQHDHAFLHALRSGRQKISGMPARLRGSSFARIRQQLGELNLQHLAAVEQSRHLQIAALPRSTETHPQASLWANSASQRHLPAFGEAPLLEDAGRDRFGRRHWLLPVALRAVKRLRHAAALDGVPLELISSFRSVRDQSRILLRKHATGQSWEDILKVNAPPGFSEHHSGCAIDFAVPDQAPLTDAFEATDAFEWLQNHAERFGFELSYPRNNRWGFIYEPWHWRYQG